MAKVHIQIFARGETTWIHPKGYYWMKPATLPCFKSIIRACGQPCVPVALLPRIITKACALIMDVEPVVKHQKPLNIFQHLSMRTSNTRSRVYIMVTGVTHYRRGKNLALILSTSA